jgi:hypothetical protein
LVDPATGRSERGEENTERRALLPYPGFRSFERRQVLKNLGELVKLKMTKGSASDIDA